MAKIISLGCKVADIHRRYSAVHSALFGASSYRLVITTLLGKTEITYKQYEQTLEELLDELVELDDQITDAAAKERISRGANQLPQTLIQYTHILHDVITQLREIFHNYRKDEEGYRAVNSENQSRFNRDKITYDHAIIQLERLGAKLNKLFSTY